MPSAAALFLYVGMELRWHTVALLCQCVGMPNDKNFQISYNYFIPKKGGLNHAACGCCICAYQRADEGNGMSMYRLAMNSGVPRSTIATIPLSETVTLATIYGVCEGFRITLQEFFDSPLFDKDKVID